MKHVQSFRDKLKSKGIYEMDTKGEIKVDPRVSDIGLNNEGGLHCSNPGRKFSNNEFCNNQEIKVKEEPCSSAEIEFHSETLTISQLPVVEKIEDGTDEDYNSSESPRLYTEGVSIGSSDIYSEEALGKDISFNLSKDSSEQETSKKFKSQENDIELSSMVETVYSEQPDGGKMDNTISCLKQNNLSKQKHKHKRGIHKKKCTQSFALPNVRCGCRKPFKCEVCEKSFTWMSQLRQHNYVHETQKPFKCDICEKCFTRLSTLKAHKLIHEGVKPHKCEVCNKTFTQLSNLKFHKLIHKGKELIYKCEICEKGFARMSYLKTHKSIHVDRQPLRCEICRKGFTQLRTLLRHNLMHQNGKPHECDICGKRFTQLSYMNLHKSIHEGKEPYKCEICEKGFIRLTHLKQHNLVHEEVKPHKCDICEKHFTRLSNLKLHKLIHEGKRPYKCDLCEDAFTELSKLKRHELTHEGIKPYKCEICEKNFCSSSSLKRHNLIHENKK